MLFFSLCFLDTGRNEGKKNISMTDGQSGLHAGFLQFKNNINYINRDIKLVTMKSFIHLEGMT
jgi:hypothetical protein